MMDALWPVAAVDSHAHLDDAAFDADRAAAIAAANEAGVRQIVNVGYNPERWRTTIELTHRWPSIYAMFGLHPHDAALWSPELGDELARVLDTEPAVALGEIGLDYFRNKAAPAIQREAFAAQIDLARRRDVPIVIHQRAADADLIDVLQGYVDLPPVVLHSFDGTAQLARFAQARGYYAGVGGLATRPANESLRAILATFPLSAILLESDAPYLTPAGVRARRNEPAFLVATANRLASLWQVEPATLFAATGETARRLFRLPEPAAAGGAGS